MTGRQEISIVMGVCAPERERVAREIAGSERARLLRAADRRPGPEGFEDLLRLIRDAAAEPGPGAVVIECHTEALPVEILGFLLASDNFPDRGIRVRTLITVVDAAHFRADLADDGYIEAWDALLDALGEPGSEREPVSGATSMYLAHAVVAAEQVEYARQICVVGSAAVPTEELRLLMALLGHLAPRAATGIIGSGDRVCIGGPAIDSVEQDSPGWLGILNGEFEPRFGGGRVGYLYYEQLRPFHPNRLLNMLNSRMEPGEFGQIIRSAGLCRFATRPETLARWNHVGQMISFEPAESDHPDSVGAIGQELAFIGIDLNVRALRIALDDCVLTDAEFAAGPHLWRSLPDPFPEWFNVRRPG